MTDDPKNFTTLSDEELARRAQAGSSSCFEELVRRFQIPLMRFLLRRLPTRFDAEDVFQETFARAYQSLRLYSSAWRFRTWIFTIAYRQAIDHLRKIRKSEDLASLADLPSPDAPPHDRLTRQENHHDLWDLARSVLSEDQFAALWLFYVEEMSAGEIAQTLGRSWVAIKTTLHRARKRLIPHLADPAENHAMIQAGET